MPSIVPGFEYDIFISYRHNDNRSGWVTEFVNILQEELAATIKEPLSIYSIKNPHDGLLEAHNVGRSLEGKPKCRKLGSPDNSAIFNQGEGFYLPFENTNFHTLVIWAFLAE